MDINKVWLSGLVISNPVLTKIGNKTPFSTFNLQVNEKYRDRSGHEKIKPNILRIESLGKSAEQTAERVRVGQRFFVDGYIRQDSYEESSDVRVRTFAVYPEDSNEAGNYREGLKQALSVLIRSQSLDGAVREIEALIASV